MFSMLRKTESPLVTNIETDYQRYNQTGSECRVRNINGCAMLPDSTIRANFTGPPSQWSAMVQYSSHGVREVLVSSTMGPCAVSYPVTGMPIGSNNTPVLGLMMRVWMGVGLEFSNQ